MALRLLYSDSEGIEGCDRLFVDGDTVIVQGTNLAGRREYSSIVVPDHETLVGVSIEAILTAASELVRHRGGRA